MYPLIALNILSPVVSKLYYSTDDKTKKYLLIITFLIPLLLKTVSQYFSYITIPLYAVGFSEFGYFLLGKYIYDKRNIIRKKISIPKVITIVAISAIVVFAYGMYDCSVYGITNNPFFDYSRFPCALYCVSFYTLFVLLKDKLQKLPNWMKQLCTNIGQNSGGIYYIHMIFVYIIGNVYFAGIGLTSNEGNLVFMILGAVLYFTASWIAINIFKKVPYLKYFIE